MSKKESKVVPLTKADLAKQREAFKAAATSHLKAELPTATKTEVTINRVELANGMLQLLPALAIPKEQESEELLRARSEALFEGIAEHLTSLGYAEKSVTLYHPALAREEAKRKAVAEAAETAKIRELVRGAVRDELERYFSAKVPQEQ